MHWYDLAWPYLVSTQWFLDCPALSFNYLREIKYPFFDGEVQSCSTLKIPLMHSPSSHLSESIKLKKKRSIKLVDPFGKECLILHLILGWFGCDVLPLPRNKNLSHVCLPKKAEKKTHHLKKTKRLIFPVSQTLVDVCWLPPFVSLPKDETPKETWRAAPATSVRPRAWHKNW